ncbi:sensor domain-containing diguanylate cyclase [Simiduia agarivorans]|uniref:diguanylate cyclase n=1 Tax=Simiduia agarivorans (strain DSM 21679 / JCM 13881 / BCRC 17597 / SA1) TaxID=1117647 RepID=K4KR53_SIMAS|nr:diguanylate cyclase [Simiduia agarivorans]AFV00619.1 diguanylate cyclase [Simiduia agarivorans SA1 = DSM 21679]
MGAGQLQAGYQLRLWAIALGGLAFSFLLIAQLAVRYWFHVPAMQQLVDVADQKDRARIESFLSSHMASLISRASDNAVWDDAYDFVQNPNERFIARSFDARSLADNEISGLGYINAAGKVLWSLGYDWAQPHDGRPALDHLPMTDPQLLEYLLIPPLVPERDSFETRSGYLATSRGPLMYASVPVLPTSFGDGTQASVGVLVVWQWLDQAFWQRAAETTQLEVSARFLPRQLASLSPPFEELRPGARSVRNRDNQLAWLLEGPAGALMLVVLELGSPQFDSGVISDALLVGMLAAALLLLVLGTCVRYWLILPLISLRGQMEALQREGDYSQRLQVNSYEELEGLSDQFNQLLDEVQRQQAMAQRRQAELQLASISDGLTGLANRRYLDQFMDESWARAKRDRISFCLLLVDVDYFKDFNDHYGHDEGDQVLRSIARVLREHQPPQDAIAARYGGEEFCLIAVGLEVSEFEALCDGLRRGILGLHIAHAKSELGVVTASLGAVFIDAQEVRLPNLSGRNALRTMFKAADSCLYESKRAGRNQVRTCDWRGLNGS